VTAGDNLPALLRVRPFADPVLDSGAVLRRDEPERNQGFDLGEAVLVQLRRALRDQHDAQAPRATAAHEIVGGMEHAAGLRIGHAALRREQVGFVDDEVQRPGIDPV
jgi:hypothetical protein